MTRISISHIADTPRTSYLMMVLTDQWRQRGIHVDVGRDFSEAADLCILHHDRTRIDKADIPAAPPHRQVLNRDVLDISKRRYSSLLVRQKDDWDGPVIVKTDLNSFGSPERRGRRRSLLEEVRKLAAKANWRLARTLSKGSYPVLPSIRDVPAWVWERDSLVVERFVPEREGDLYCLRGWLFFGSASYGYRLFSTIPVVKTGSMVRYEYLEEVPAELERHRREMKFDFGKFDYVVHDGSVILIDANKTPTFAGNRNTPRLRQLANAIEEFLP